MALTLSGFAPNGAWESDEAADERRWLPSTTPGDGIVEHRGTEHETSWGTSPEAGEVPLRRCGYCPDQVGHDDLGCSTSTSV